MQSTFLALSFFYLVIQKSMKVENRWWKPLDQVDFGSRDMNI